ncbi:MAG: hypothetical protein AB1505_16880 [Candidatus Latescibacterota bacterium]
MGSRRRALLVGLLAVVLAACGGREPEPADGVDAGTWSAAVGLADTVGVRNLAEGDTTCGHRGLVAIELSRGFGDGEAVAWEFQACRLTPVKLIVVRLDQQQNRFELLGESQTVVPRRLGENRFLLPEPIPVRRRCFLGLVFPEEEAVPFRQVMDWQTLITTRPLQRPYMPRDLFASYGWRYSVRVLWRPAQGRET